MRHSACPRVAHSKQRKGAPFKMFLKTADLSTPLRSGRDDKTLSANFKDTASDLVVGVRLFLG
jgi:hypothetical protein